MMGIEDVVETLGKATEKNFTLHISMTRHPKFKIYKILEYKLFLSSTVSQTLLFSKSYIVNAPADDMKEVWKEHDKKFLLDLFKWYGNGVQIQ